MPGTPQNKTHFNSNAGSNVQRMRVSRGGDLATHTFYIDNYDYDFQWVDEPTDFNIWTKVDDATHVYAPSEPRFVVLTLPCRHIHRDSINSRTFIRSLWYGANLRVRRTPVSVKGPWNGSEGGSK